MRILHSLLLSWLLVAASVIEAASSWNFEDGSVSITSRGGVGASKEKISNRGPLSKSIILGATDSLKVLLTSTEDGKAKRPHQVFLLLKDQDTSLETTFPLTVKETGKGKVDFTQKDLPIQFLTSKQPLQATLLIASFGSSAGFFNPIFNLEVKLDPNTPLPHYEKPLRYGKQPEIHHIFKTDPKSGPKVISVFFVLAMIAAVPILLGMWAYLGANLDHLGKATAAAPISHALFFGSILAMEGIFYLYYSSWNLFKTLPAAGIVGLVAFLSGSKALSEVQGRRLAGER